MSCPDGRKEHDLKPGKLCRSCLYTKTDPVATEGTYGKDGWYLDLAKAHDRDSTRHPEWRVRAVPHDFTDPR